MTVGVYSVRMYLRFMKRHEYKVSPDTETEEEYEASCVL